MAFLLEAGLYEDWGEGNWKGLAEGLGNTRLNFTTIPQILLYLESSRLPRTLRGEREETITNERHYLHIFWKERIGPDF